MKIISLFFAFAILIAAVAVIISATPSSSPFTHEVETAIRVWNEARDKIINENNLPYKTTQDYPHHHDRMMRAFSAEVPDGPELDAVMKKYDHLKENILERLTDEKSENFYVPLTNFPQQVHLAVTNTEGQISVMWVTANTSSGSQVCTRPVSSDPNSHVAFNCNNGSSWTYHPISVIPWYGNIHHAVMSGIPGQNFEYTVGDPSLNVTSQIFTYKVPQLNKDELFVYLGGDQGTVQLCGHLVAKQMYTDFITQDAANPPDAFWMIGDVAYSTLDPPKDSFEFFWDWYLQQEQSLLSRIPGAFVPGNHDSDGGDWGAFINRFRMPQNQIQGEGNFYWAYSHGPVTFISMCTEVALNPICDYSPGSKQYRWIEAQLAAVDRIRTPWVVLAGHRPFLSSDKSTDSGMLPNDIGPLFQKYGVDVNLAGHMHENELAIWPAINGTLANLTGVTKISQNSWHVRNPKNTVAITAGALGAVINEKFVTPQPEWSLARGGTFWDGEYNYGYATMKATKTSLEFAFRAQKTNTTLWSVVISK